MKTIRRIFATLLATSLGLIVVCSLGYIFFLAFIFFSAATPRNPHNAFDVWASSDCTPMQLGSVISPDDILEAKAFHVLCTAPLEGFFANTADHTAVVIVERGGIPSSEANLMNLNLSIGQAHLMQWETDMRWQSTNELQITLPSSVSIWEQKPTVAGVTVDIVRVPDRRDARQSP